MTKILVMDDNLPLLEAMSDILVVAGHVVTVAANGANAVDLVRSKGVELVITDLFMPDKEGLETIRELRRQFPHLRIIAMSGGAGRKTGAALGPGANLTIAMKLGAMLTINKPFTDHQLIDAVATAMK